MIQQIKRHRSTRSYVENRPIPREVMQQLIEAATRASTTGGMQLYSIIVSSSDEMKERLSPLHFNQPMVRQCSAVVTFCADVARFSKWCEMRDAQPAYNNFAWYVNAAIDALLASENFSLEAQNQGLGICYLGTTIYTTAKLIEVLELPKGVVPVTTVVVGYPAKEHPLTPRLPLEAVWQEEKYTEHSEAEIDELYSELESSEATKALLENNELPNLARIFTERRYKREDNEAISASYFEALRTQGFI